MGLDTVELVMAVEEHFGISIADEDAVQLVTVGDIHEFVITALAEKRHAKVPEQAAAVAWEQVVDIVVGQLGVSRDEVTRTARVVEDLRAD